MQKYSDCIHSTYSGAPKYLAALHVLMDHTSGHQKVSECCERRNGKTASIEIATG